MLIFFFPNFLPLPHVQSHWEMPSSSQPLSWDLKCVSDSSFPDCLPVLSVLPQTSIMGFLRSLNSQAQAQVQACIPTQNPQHPCNDNNPVPQLPTAARSLFLKHWLYSFPFYPTPVFKALHPLRPRCLSSFIFQPLVPGSLPSSDLWPLCPMFYPVCLKLQSKATSSLLLSSNPSTS